MSVEVREKTWIDRLQDHVCKYAYFTGTCEAILTLQRSGLSAEQCLSELQEAINRLKRELGEQ